MIFQTKEVLDDKNLKKFQKLYNANNLVELDFLKLLMGLSKITFNENEINQPNNYCYLGIKPNTSKDFLFSSIVDFLKGKNSKFYFEHNRKNNKIFSVLLNELGLYFISKNENKLIEGFIHLYRMIEQVSLMFPLLYFKQSSDFKGVFEDLKELITNKEMTTLKFFKNFQEQIFEDKAMLDNTMYFTFYVSTEDEKNELKIIFDRIISSEIQKASLDGNTISMPFRDIINFAITIRNRYFHLSIRGQDNIDAINLNINDFFSSINEYILNWIAVIYYEMFKILNK